MFSYRAVATLMLIGSVAVGCNQKPTTPAASTLQPMDQRAVAQLTQSFRSTHPGSEVGVVNAVIPDRHILSVGGIPADAVHRGDVMSILIAGQSGMPVAGVVYDTADGYVQLRYEPVAVGQADPHAGDLAVWYPGGAKVPPSAMESPAERAVAPLANVPPPAPTTQPEMREAAPPAAPATIAPPTTAPAESTAPPATSPSNPPPVTETPVAPATRPAPDFNK